MTGTRPSPLKRILKSWGLFTAASLALFLRAAAPPIINYQGKLTNKDGNPASGTSGRLTFAVSLYDNAGGTGQPLFGESHVNVPVANGVFNLPIGGGTSQTSTLLSAVQGRTDVWLQIAVGGDVLLPRQRLAASPYALAVAAGSVGGPELQENLALTKNLNIESNTFFVDRANDRVGIGTASPASKLSLLGPGGQSIDFLVNGRIQTGDAANSGGIWLNASRNIFVGQSGPEDIMFWTTQRGAALRVLQGGDIILSAPNPLKISSAWSAFPDAAANQAEISNDTVAYKTLMIVGNKSAGGSRRVGLWDDVTVAGTLYAGGTVRGSRFIDDDANYYVDSNVTSIMNSINLASGNPLNFTSGGIPPNGSIRQGGHLFMNSLTNHAVIVNWDNGAAPPGNWAFTVGNGQSTGKFIVDYSGTLSIAGSAWKPGGGGWSDSSDIRLKKNVQPLAGSLDKLLRLRGVTFEWKEPAKHGNLTGTQTGMIAQEVEKVFPEWIANDPEGFKGFGFRGFEALAVEALRELKAENEALKARIKSLEDRLNAAGR